MASHRKSKEYYLQNSIFLLLYIKDFVNAEKYIDEYCGQKFSQWEAYQTAWKEIQKLLEKIKDTLATRKQRDFFWLDALPHDDEKNMPFLSSLSKKALVFENMFAVTPYTQSALKTMMCSKRVLDDQSYRIDSIHRDNSLLLQALQQNGISFDYCGCVYKYFSELYLLQPHIDYYESASNIFWNVLDRMLQSTTPVFCIAHELFGTHNPYRMIDPCAKRYIWEGFSEANKKEYSRTQCLASMMQTDALIQMVSSLLPPNCAKIYMSDHGDFRFGKNRPLLSVYWG